MTAAGQRITARQWPTDPFDKALAAEPRLQAVDRLVRLIVATAPTRESGKSMCADCFWIEILKPIVETLVGWERGICDQAEEQPPDPCEPIDLAEAWDAEDQRPAATSSTEEWLRGSVAYDVVTDRGLKARQGADPANGCGLPRWPEHQPT